VVNIDHARADVGIQSRQGDLPGGYVHGAWWRRIEAGEVAMAALARGAYPGRRLPRQMLPAVSTVGYWDATHDQKWGLGEHRNEGVEITYLANGHLDFRVDGRKHALVPGNLTITRPWQPHSVGNPTVGSSRLYWLILDVGIRQPHQMWRWPSWLVLSKADLRELTALMRENEHSGQSPAALASSAPMSELPKAYEPQAVEAKWYAAWIEGKMFRSRPLRPRRRRIRSSSRRRTSPASCTSATC
jgi:hypothetical protein